jgi:MYXO-CTERM domain-containing protein
MVGEAICQGDSGGPALSDTTGAILGVVSRGGNGNTPNPSDPASSCIGAINFYSMASAYKDMILDAYSQAGQDPWVENGPDPRLAKFGEACTSADSCRSALCLTDKAGNPTTCTQTCDPTNPCPDSTYECTTHGTASFCTVKPPPAPPAHASSGGCSSSPQSRDGWGAWGLAAALLACTTRRRLRTLR